MKRRQWPIACTCLFIASLPIVRPFNFTLFGLLVPVSDLIFAAAALTWVVGVARGRESVHYSRFYLVLAAYFAALCPLGHRV